MVGDRRRTERCGRRRASPIVRAARPITAGRERPGSRVVDARTVRIPPTAGAADHVRATDSEDRDAWPRRDSAAPGRAKIAAKTLRTDRWWVAPLLTVVVLVAWITYATVRVFMQKNYWRPRQTTHYLTPFYSPCVSDGLHPRGVGEFGSSCPTCGGSRTRR